MRGRRIALLPVVLALSALSIWWLLDRADHGLREDLLRQARVVTGAVDNRQIRSLGGVRADQNTPEYQRLKERFSAIRAADARYRFIYLMGRRPDGAVFFYVDSEPAGSAMESPPGQIYHEVPEITLRVFDSPDAEVVGPVADRWGVWVSALVPLTDELSGETVAVLGVDIDGNTWYANVAGRAALPVALVLVITIGLIAMLLAPALSDAPPKPVLRRLLPVLIVSLALLVGGSWGLLVRTDGSWSRSTSLLVQRHVAEDLERLLAGQGSALAALQEVLLNEELTDALAVGDRDRLLALSRPVYESLNARYGVTHFYFSDPGRICLIRAHQPDRYGDRFDRFTALEAERTGRSASGIELGPLGTFTLRVVRPVFREGALLGYLELGKEIEDVLDSLSATERVERIVLVRKDQLDRTRWEAGMAMLGRAAQWERFPDHALIYSSVALTEEVEHLVGRSESEWSGQIDREGTLDGRRWRVLAEPLTDASGDEVGHMVLMHDITALRAARNQRAAIAGAGALVLLTALLGMVIVMLRRTDAGILTQQAALRHREEHLAATLRSIGDGVITCDSQARVTSLNRAAESLTGWTSADAASRPLEEIFPVMDAKTRVPIETPVTRVLAQGVGVDMANHTALIARDGREYQIADSCAPILDRTGSVTGAVLVFRDVTEEYRRREVLRASEERLREFARDLEEKNRELDAAAGRAEQASRAKSEFLANMSHEIRTPMNGVIGMTGLLLDTDLTAEQRRYAETVQTSGEALLSLVNDILDFSKIEAGKLDMETLEFDLQSMLEDFSASLAIRTHDRGLELVCACDPAVPTQLIGDPGRLRQILINLAGNAVKFTHQGEVAIRVTPEEDRTGMDNTVLLRFSVCDTGIGIPADKIDALFEQFTQVDASTTRRYGGTGLGLAISRRLSEMMGGEIGVNSVEGEGSEFWFTARFAPGREKPRRTAVTPAGLRGVRVLIVDDNATNREILSKNLANWGMRPIEAADGPTGLQELYRAVGEGEPFRLAVIDMQMPGMDGETLGRIVTADTKLAETRMVMLTSLGARGDTQRLREAGFSGYAVKPIRQEELMGVLVQALEARTDAAGMDGEFSPIATRHTAREALPDLSSRRARILLAEDNITNQQVAMGILKKLGMSAHAVANGKEALVALETLPWDLVLMDVQMPEMDGLEATRRIRESGRTIPVIAMTAHAMRGDREKCIHAGMNDYVSKPVSPHALAEVLQKWLPGAPPGAPSTDSPADPSTDSPADPPTDPPTDPPAAAAVPVFDRAALLERLMDDEELLETIVEAFLKDIPQQIEALARAVDAADAPAIHRLAHTIKGAAANIGGEVLRERARVLEDAAGAGDLSGTAPLLRELREAYEELAQVLTLHSSQGS